MKKLTVVALSIFTILIALTIFSFYQNVKAKVAEKSITKTTQDQHVLNSLNDLDQKNKDNVSGINKENNKTENRPFQVLIIPFLFLYFFIAYLLILASNQERKKRVAQAIKDQQVIKDIITDSLFPLESITNKK
jgi:NADH:ubiquinone oxidoreductase subunit 6 (subunit J)